MGHVYRALDHRLSADVVIKIPVSSVSENESPDFLERFGREVRSLVRLGHPHIVKVIDVGQHAGRPYVVMQYLDGGSLRSRLESGHGGRARRMAVQSLGTWLMEVARALDFIHSQGFLHRDVKPANILFDRFGHAYLADLGIIKALSTSPQTGSRSSLTAPGFLLGTPCYVAPEVVLGHPVDGRVDQYALAMTVHEVLVGDNCMEGPTASATVVNQTTLVPPPLIEVVGGITRSLSDAIDRALAKDPEDRFPNCVAMARAALAGVPSHSASSSATLPLPGVARPSDDDEIPTLYSPDTDFEPDPADAVAETVVTGRPAEAGETVLAPAAGHSQTRRVAPVFVWAALVTVAVAGLSWIVVQGQRPDRRAVPPQTPALVRTVHQSTQPPPLAAARSVPALPLVEVNIAYGTEKREWIESALLEFQKTPASRTCRIRLLPMGSHEGADAILEGPGPTPIHVWSPASAVYRDVFERAWRQKRRSEPILDAKNLAFTPMVFLFWSERHDQFIKKYSRVTFRNIADAVAESGGWGSIAGRPEWGDFQFTHTDPLKSNSGLLTLALMAYEYTGARRHLAASDVARDDFQRWLQSFERGVARRGSPLVHSSGTMMREMISKGPAETDGAILYESLAIASMNATENMPQSLHVSYPEPNVWNEHPYYVLNVPWSDSATRVAARRFRDFLMSEPIQRKALQLGLRPGNPAVPVHSSDSPFVRHAAHGIRADLPSMGEPPNADVIERLLAAFARTQH